MVEFFYVRCIYCWGDDDSYLRGTKSIAVLYFDPFSTDKDIEFYVVG